MEFLVQSSGRVEEVTRTVPLHTQPRPPSSHRRKTSGVGEGLCVYGGVDSVHDYGVGV